MPLTMMSSREEEALRFFQYVEDSGLRSYSGVVTRDPVWNEKIRSVPEKNDKKRKQEEVVKRLASLTLTPFTLGYKMRLGFIGSQADTKWTRS